MQNLWNPKHQRLIEWLKKEILSGPTLSILDLSRRFYIRTDWSKDGMGAVLMQSDVSEEARKPEAQEKEVRKYEFLKSLEVMRLQPLYFISGSTLLPLTKSRQNFVVETSAVRWDIGK